eukprot:jgi/Mesen1/6697/ME000343S05873
MMQLSAAAIGTVSSFHITSSLGGSSLRRRSSVGRSARQQHVLPVTAGLTPEELSQREDARWQREEQRWLREEERWVREEGRWQEERQALEGEIRVLRQALAAVYGSVPPGQVGSFLETLRAWEGTRKGVKSAPLDAEVIYRALAQAPGAALPASMAPLAAPGTGGDLAGDLTAKELLQLVPDADIIAAVASRSVGASNSSSSTKAPVSPPPPAAAPAPSPPAAAAVAPAAGARATGKAGGAAGAAAAAAPVTGKAVAGGARGGGAAAGSKGKARRTLKTGTEGEDVRLIQVGRETAASRSPSPAPKAPASPPNARPAAASTSAPARSAGGSPAGAGRAVPRAPTHDRPEAERYSRSGIEAGDSSTSHRVFLLGENRWEDPDRMEGLRSDAASLAAGRQVTPAAPKCHACRGEGHVVCMECEGTGQLNVEEQFLDWVDEEEQKCVYCEGRGAVPCDLCDGSGRA